MRNILLVGKNTGLTDRLDLVLSRTYSVINAFEVFYEYFASDADEVPFECFDSFCKYKKLEFVVLSSDVLASNNENMGQLIWSIIKSCREIGLKLIFCVQSSPIIATDDEKFAFADEYLSFYKKRLEVFQNEIHKKKDLYVTVDTVLGAAINPKNNLLSHSNNNGKIMLHTTKGEENIVIALADDIVNMIVSEIDSSGEMEIKAGLLATRTDFISQLRLVLDSSKKNYNFKYEPLHELRSGAYQSHLEIEQFHNVAISQQNCVFEVVYRMSPRDSISHESIASFRRRLGAGVAEEIPFEAKAAIDCIVPVPETGKHYAQGLAEVLEVPYVEALFKNPKSGRSFDILNTDERRHFLYEKLSVIRDLVQGKSICLVDEAIFTGATLKVVSNILRGMGAKKIYIAIPTPKCHSQCHVNMQPPRSMLLEYQRSEDLPLYFDVDGIFFKKVTAFEREINEVGRFCYQCFSETKR